MVFILKAFLLLLLIKLLVGSTCVILSKYGFINSVKNGDNLTSWLSEVSTIRFFVEVVILAPLLEEFCFRGITQSNSTVLIYSSITFLYLFSCRLNGVNFYEFHLKSILILLVSVTLCIIFKDEIISTFLTINASTISRIFLVYLSSIFFALWHYNNYNFANVNFQTKVLTLLPHFLSGLIFSWFAIKYGIKWSLSAHIFNNFIAVIITLIIA
ncbi:CPBP family glutamic-type intramembrane protease [Spirosoma oryzae]